MLDILGDRMMTRLESNEGGRSARAGIIVTQWIFCAARARLSHAHVYAHVHEDVRYTGTEVRDREGAMLEDSLYLDNLQEFVQDESRIVREHNIPISQVQFDLSFPTAVKVTYKWLSRKLDVPTDAAKR